MNAGPTCPICAAIHLGPRPIIAANVAPVLRKRRKAGAARFELARPTVRARIRSRKLELVEFVEPGSSRVVLLAFSAIESAVDLEDTTPLRRIRRRSRLWGADFETLIAWLGGQSAAILAILAGLRMLRSVDHERGCIRRSPNSQQPLT